MSRRQVPEGEPAADSGLCGRICVVTGATAGIGREIARHLAARGATVLLAGRSLARCEAAAAEIARETGGEVVPALLDLAYPESIRAFAARFTDGRNRLDVLVNNAAVWLPERRLSASGIELTWATNVLGPHLLAWMLRGSLRASGRARVVNVASTMAGGLDLEDVEFRRRRYSGIAAYRQSKQALRMLSWTLAARLADGGVAVNAAHPGFTSTCIARNTMGPAGCLARAFFRCGQAPREGADTPAWLAASPEAEGLSGLFWADRRERPCAFRNPAALEQLWEVLCRQNGIPNSGRSGC